MNRMETVKEWSICEVTREFGVTRRAIQGYEKLGLVNATGKTQKGYLFYDDDAVKRITEIKFYQSIGIELKEIKEMIDSSPELKAISLGKKREELDKKIKDLSNLLTQLDLVLENK